MAQNDERVAALLEERRGYEVRGMKGRVAEVDAALAEYGVEVEKPAPKKRAARKADASVETADEG